jgi:hypothetical protein
MAITLSMGDLKEKQKPKRADRMTAFLYSLIRDRLTMGEVEELLDDLGTDSHFILANARIAGYAEELKKRILGAESDRDGQSNGQPK